MPAEIRCRCGARLTPPELPPNRRFRCPACGLVQTLEDAQIPLAAAPEPRGEAVPVVCRTSFPVAAPRRGYAGLLAGAFGLPLVAFPFGIATGTYGWIWIPAGVFAALLALKILSRTAGVAGTGAVRLAAVLALVFAVGYSAVTAGLCAVGAGVSRVERRMKRPSPAIAFEPRTVTATPQPACVRRQAELETILRRFHGQHGRWPASLAEMGPEAATCPEGVAYGWQIRGGKGAGGEEALTTKVWCETHGTWRTIERP